MGKNSFSRDQIGNFGKTIFSKEDMKKERLKHDRIRSLGIRIPDSFGDANTNCYSEDELIALECIYSNKAIPEDIEQRLINKITLKNSNMNKKDI